MHHIDIHVADLAVTRRLLAAVLPPLGYALRADEPAYVSYWKDQARPSLGFIAGGGRGSGMMRIAFATPAREAVDAIAAAARASGAHNVDGPGFHPEYGDDYYAVFFEDADGNKFEITIEETSP